MVLKREMERQWALWPEQKPTMDELAMDVRMQIYK
jgi:hypothetical protein